VRPWAPQARREEVLAMLSKIGVVGGGNIGGVLIQ
jgi:hypothetical protein